jgi:hypothetical protein
VVGIVEDEGGGLVDRRGPGAGRRIGLGAGMNGQRIETGRTGHLSLPLLAFEKSPGILGEARVGMQRRKYLSGRDLRRTTEKIHFFPE